MPRARRSSAFIAVLVAACWLGAANAAAQAPPAAVETAEPVQLTPEQLANIRENGAKLEADFFGLTAPIPEAEPFAFEIRAWTEGPVAPTGEVSLPIPNGTLLAARPACETWIYEPESRVFKIGAAWIPGQVHNCSIQLLAPEDRGNLYFALETRSFVPEAYDRVEREVPMESQTSGKVLFRIGRVGIRALEIAVFLPLFLVLGAIVLGRRARRRRQGAMPILSSYELFAAAVIGLSFLAYFVVLAVADWRSLSFPETRCEILDVERVVQASKSTSGTKSSRETYSFDARLSVLYDLAGVSTVAVGTRPESYLDLSEKRAAKFLESFQRGATIPCWVDPQNPRKALVQRGFGGAYGFALLPLALLGVVLLFWRRR